MAGDTIPSISMRALFTTEESSTSMGIKLVFNMTISEGKFHEFKSGVLIFIIKLGVPQKNFFKTLCMSIISF